MQPNSIQKDSMAANQTPKSPLVVGNTILNSRMSPNSLRDSALINAVRNNDEAQVRELERTESGLKNAQDETALMVAAANNSAVFCKILVSAEKFITNYRGQDAYMIAAQHGNMDALNALRQHFVLRPDMYNMNALDYAVLSQSTDAVNLILSSQIIRQSDISHAILLANKRGFTTLENVLKSKIPATKDFPCKRCEHYLNLFASKISIADQAIQTQTSSTDNSEKNFPIKLVEPSNFAEILAKKDAEIHILQSLCARQTNMVKDFDIVVMEKNTEIDDLKHKLDELTSQRLSQSYFNNEIEKYKQKCEALQARNDELKRQMNVNRSSILQEAAAAGVTSSSHVSPDHALLHGSGIYTPTTCIYNVEARRSSIESSGNSKQKLRGSTPSKPSAVAVVPTASRSVQVNVQWMKNYEMEISTLKARLGTAEEAIKRYRANYDSLYKLSAARQNAARALKTENEDLKNKITQLKDTILRVTTMSNRQSLDLSNLSYKAEDDVFHQDSIRLSDRNIVSPQIPRCLSPSVTFSSTHPLDTSIDDPTLESRLSGIANSAALTGSAVESGTRNTARLSQNLYGLQNVQSIHTIANTSIKNLVRDQSNVDTVRASIGSLSSLNNITSARTTPSRISRSITPYENRNSTHIIQPVVIRSPSRSTTSVDELPQLPTDQRLGNVCIPNLSTRNITKESIVSPRISADRWTATKFSGDLDYRAFNTSPSRILQHANAPVVPPNIDELTPLMIAVIECNFSKFNESISYAKQQTSTGKTALMYAVECNRHTFVQDLIPFEAKMKDSNGHTALYHAIMTGRYRIAELLRDSEGIQVSHRSRIGGRRTELMQAVLDNDIVSVWCLASMQASLQDENGVTALMLAVKSMNIPAIEILYPMEYKLMDKENRTARDYIMLVPPTATDAQREAVQNTLNRNKL